METNETRIPWEEIGKPATANGFTHKRVNGVHPHDFFWGRDIEGRYVFRFMGQFPADLADSAPKMSGVKIVGGQEDERSHLSLILDTPDNREIFYYLCLSILHATEKMEDEPDSAIAKIVLIHLARWQKLLKNSSNLLSEARQIGLFGELALLRDLYLPNLGGQAAIDCWVGPLDHEQDFGYGNSLCEVKTSKSTSDAKASIASLEQLDPVSGDITLVFQTVSVFEDQPPNSFSLNGIVRQIEALLESATPDVMEQFGMRLSLYGYVPHPEYEKRCFALVNRRIFAVEGKFPRLVRSSIPGGVERLSYTINIEACADFELSPMEGAKRILEGESNSLMEEVIIAPELLVHMEESKTLEFKASFRYCYSQNKNEKYIEDNIVKAVAGLSNSAGGTLVIGVRDQPRKVLGLENDFLSTSDRDNFELKLTQLLVNNFGESHIAKNIFVKFETVDNKDLCLVLVQRGDSPRFIEVKDKNGVKSKKLYARLNNSTRPISIDEVPEFTKDW